ncbi:MAG: hypothetical protein ABR562_00300 [Thermoplasmatota archaeon]
MANARALLSSSLVGLALAVALGTIGSLPIAAAQQAWGPSHTSMSLFGFLMPGLAFLHWQVAGVRMPRSLGDPAPIAMLWLLGAILVALGKLAGPSGIAIGLLAFGGIALLAAAGLQTGAVLKAAPKRSESVVDVAKDPLSKGDDASLKHIRFAHMVFLPLSILGVVATLLPVWPAGSQWPGRVQLASYHWLLAGYALLSVYGLSHIVVPRFAKVPAIAAGAIKGELHSSLLGLVLLAAGFLIASPGLLIAGGAMLFLGAFVFMGVLGANIMKNKSPTQRVTPEFAYIPWTFAGIFWLVAGVLLGLFLSAAAVRFPAVLPSLRFVHVHATLLGGFAMLLMGFATRILPAAVGRPPVPFSRTRWAFYGLNVALPTMFYGHLTAGIDSTPFIAGAVLAGVSLAAWFISLLPSVRGATR